MYKILFLVFVFLTCLSISNGCDVKYFLESVKVTQESGKCISTLVDTKETKVLKKNHKDYVYWLKSEIIEKVLKSIGTDEDKDLDSLLLIYNNENESGWHKKSFSNFVNEKEIDSCTIFVNLIIEELSLVKNIKITDKMYTSDTYRVKRIGAKFSFSLTNMFGDTLSVQEGSVSKPISNTGDNVLAELCILIFGDVADQIAKNNFMDKEKLFKTDKTNIDKGGEYVTKRDNIINNTISLLKENVIISGIILNNSGYALTDYRLFVNDKELVKVVLSSGDTCKVKLVKCNKLLNTALIKVDLGQNVVKSISIDNQRVEMMDNVVFWGTPGSLILKNTFFEGHIAGNVNNKGINYYFIDSVPHWGYTGGGVFNSQLQLLGLNLLMEFDERLNLVMPCLPINTVYSSLLLNSK